MKKEMTEAEIKAEIGKINVVEQKMTDTSLNPGFVATYDPDEAELAGAFIEDALSFEDAWESRFDIEIE